MHITLRSHLKRNTDEVGEPDGPQIELFFGRKVKYSMDSLFDWYWVCLLVGK